MAHPIFYPGRFFFYPVGNTPPVFLTEYLAPEESADILLLGCGDVRNVLFTISSAGIDNPGDQRRFDFTCCDWEGATLARNVILYTLIADGEHTHDVQQIWNIYYHFFLDEDSLSLLLKQCQKLVDLAQNIEIWNSGPYASFLRMSSSHTLREVKRLWELYLSTTHFSPSKTQQFKHAFSTGMKQANTGSGEIRATRSAGPLWMDATKPISKAFDHFWSTGITSADSQDIATSTHVNPTFAFSREGEGFVAHYGTLPLFAFHLAPTWISECGDPVRGMYDLARSTFSCWCNSFSGCIREDRNKVIIRILYADVLSACHTLASFVVNKAITSNHRVSPWSVESIVLDGGDYAKTSPHEAPSTFSVIDTSNLSDHIGLVNILVASRPLLSPSPTSTLYTESLLMFGEDATSSFIARMLGDISTMSTALDITPIDHVSKFATHSSLHEILPYKLSGVTGQYHEHIPWKIPSLIEKKHKTSALTMTPQSVVALLFEVYLSMFSCENMMSKLKNSTPKWINKQRSNHYCRPSFALFILEAQRRIATDWTQVMRELVNAILSDRQLLTGSNNMQDLLCYLHILALYPIETLYPPGVDEALLAQKLVSRLNSWYTVPPILCVTLVVPRNSLQYLDASSAALLTPNLQGRVSAALFANSYTLLQTCFGNIESSDDRGSVCLQENPSGRDGTSPFIVSFWIPASILTHAPNATKISLAVLTTPATATALMSKLGLQLILYSASVGDTSHVFFSRHPPAMMSGSGDPATLSYPPPTPASNSSQNATVAAEYESKRITTFAARTNIVDDAMKSCPSERSSTIVLNPQKSLVRLSFTLGTFPSVQVHFPYPVNGVKAKIRVARTSSYIEVVAPLADSRSFYDFTVQPFPIVMHASEGILAPWNVHRVNLDQLPALDTSNPRRLAWLNPHVSLMMSDREGMIRSSPSKDPVAHCIVDLKDSLHCIFNHIAGTQGRKAAVFALNCASSRGIDTFLFVSALRLDLSAHTVVADGYVLPLTSGLLSGAMERVITSPKFMSTVVQVQVTPEELVMWKHALPAMVERARTWRHQPSCAYISRGLAPLSVEHGETPICGCGTSQDNDAIKRKREWAVFAPYVTRLAISPIFSVPYLESVGDLSTRFAKTSPQETPSSPGRPPGSQLRCQSCSAIFSPTVKPLVCSRCKTVRYCGKPCQTSDWKRHKAVCRPPPVGNR
ncbi:hypothetical protein K474DRAFT_1600754 [Panus rudis PR-1116 ss-1]|nr:hypothetical protein K474DRAFT_1600754 [Panus rudis PR-1116 ss-1]